MKDSPSRRYDVTVTVARDGETMPDPVAFAIAAEQAAAARRVGGVMSAHSAEQIITVVTVQTSERPSAVAVALAVVSEALRRPAASSSQQADNARRA
jgi:hypothetical protein